MYAQLENQLTTRLLSFFVVLNKVYESSASTFTGNFLGLEGVEMISSIKFIGSVMPQSGLFAWLQVERGSVANPFKVLQVGGKSFKSFEEWHFLGLKFLTIALSWRDIERVLKVPMQSVAGLEYCLFELKDSMLSFKYGTKLQAFRGVGKMTLIY